MKKPGWRGGQREKENRKIDYWNKFIANEERRIDLSNPDVQQQYFPRTGIRLDGYKKFQAEQKRKEEEGQKNLRVHLRRMEIRNEREERERSFTKEVRKEERQRKDLAI